MLLLDCFLQQPASSQGCFFYVKEGKGMKGTVSYYVEALQTNVMNRLVENETTSLQAKYEQLWNEIELVEENLQATYKENLTKAYTIVRNAMTFVESDEVIV